MAKSNCTVKVSVTDTEKFKEMVNIFKLTIEYIDKSKNISVAESEKLKTFIKNKLEKWSE